MIPLNVLIACEESQIECLAFRKFGCNAFSCDLQKSSGGFPQFHFHFDCKWCLNVPGWFVTEKGNAVYIDHWDLLIAHPPCTYLSKVSPIRTKERLLLGFQAKGFFMTMLNAPVKYVAVENPIPRKIFDLPKPSFSCDPYDFGSPWRKKTLYWLRNLPPLMYGISAVPLKSWVHCTRGSKKRSRSFPCIANAMAEQWTAFIINDLAQPKSAQNTPSEARRRAADK